MENFRAPKDKYCMIYLLFVINGIGTLLSWNMFINAADYFINFKFSEEYIKGEFSPKTNFMQYLTFSSQIPACLFQWTNIFWEVKGGLTLKILFGTLGISITFLIQIFFAIIDTSDFPMGFFVITLLCAIVSNCCNGIYQNSVFGMSASLPPKFTGAIILGNQICGTFTSLVEIVSRACSRNSRLAAIYYFLIALISLFICFDTIYALPLNKFYRYHKQRQELLQKSRDEVVKEKLPFLHLMNEMKLALYDVFMNLFITITCFPAVLVSIQPITGESFLGGYFASVLCFLTFNVTALIGSIMAPRIKWPKQKYLWMYTTARFLFIPIFLFCNYKPNNVKRTWPVLLRSDVAYWIFNILFGLSNGYGISLSMMYAPGVVEPKYSTQAGMIAAAVLLTGVLSGILVSFIWPIIVAL